MLKQKTKTILYLVLFAISPIWVSVILGIIFQSAVVFVFGLFWPVTTFMAMIGHHKFVKKQKSSQEKESGMSEEFKVIVAVVVVIFIALMTLSLFE